MRYLLMCLVVIGLGGAAAAQDRSFVLRAPDDLRASGLFDYLLPRFTLKTQVRVRVVPDGPAALILSRGPDGRPVFRGSGGTWHMRAGKGPGADRADRFADWLTGEIGRRTIAAYAPDGTAPFAPADAETAQEAAPDFDGDADLGRRVSLLKCGRCHVIDDSNRMKAIGSTPSFAMLRGLANWEERFTGFFVLNPHPAFTQVVEVTAPFAPDRPSPIAPVVLTLQELDAIIAFVAATEPADLGAPIRSQ